MRDECHDFIQIETRNLRSFMVAAATKLQSNCGRLLIMAKLPLKLLALLILAIGQTKAQHVTESERIPASIHEIQTQFVEETSGQGQGRSMVQVYVFHLRCSLIPNNSSFASSPPFKFVGSLPNGQSWSQVISPEDCFQAADGVVCFDVDIYLQKCGWGTFTLTTSDAQPQDNVYLYEVHSNFQLALFDCST
jgi:hypothetical protein